MKENKNSKIIIAYYCTMSQAFIRESDDQWLSDIAPTLNALIIFLTRENNGIKAFEKRSYQGEDGRTIHEMSNGLSYARDANGKWEIIVDNTHRERHQS